MGQAAERTVADLVHGLLTSTANLKDGKPLFHADRKNLLTAAAISAASFGKAVTAMGTQKDSAGKTLALRPSFLIIPVALQMEAYQLLNATVIGTQAEPNRPNPWTNYCTPVIEPRLDGTGALPVVPRRDARHVPFRGVARRQQDPSRGTAAGLDHRRHGIQGEHRRGRVHQRSPRPEPKTPA